MFYAITDEDGVLSEVFNDETVYELPAGAIELTEDQFQNRWDWVLVGGNLEHHPHTPPDSAVIVPAKVTMRQARLALLSAGRLDDVEAAINGMADATQRQAARIEWDFSSEVFRNKPFVLQLGAALGLDASEMDELFIAAAGIQ